MRLFILLFFVGSLYGVEETIESKAQKTEVRKKELLTIINKEFKILDDISRLKKHRDPRILYRKIELYAEKIKIIKEYENKKFISGEIKNRHKAFVESRGLYEESLRLGKILLKKFPRFKKRANIYYSLALNSRDFSDGKITEGYLLKALRSVGKQKTLKHNIHTGLADYYYNSKKFKKAIKHYEIVIKNNEDNWKTKYSFNLAWCYLKVKKYNKSITLLRETFEDSKKKEYVDISEQILGHIGLFYALGNRVNAGIEFYISNTKNPVPYLIKMSNLLIQRGLFKLSESTLNKALSIAKSKTIEDELSVYRAKMGLYEESKHIGKHYKSSLSVFRIAKEHKLKKFDHESMTLELTNFVNYIQKGFHGKTLRLSKEMGLKFANIIIQYFKMLSFFDPGEQSKYLSFIAETYYSVDKKGESLKQYRESYHYAKKEKRKVQEVIKILKSILSVLGENLPKNITNQYLEWAYVEYLETSPNDDLARGIYPKLYSFYHQKKDFKKSYEVLLNYNKHFDQDIKIQKDLFLAIFDQIIFKKNINLLKSWYELAIKSKIKIPSNELSKINNILGSMLFNDVTKISSSSSEVHPKVSDEIVQKYSQLFYNKNYKKEIRLNSGYNLSIFYLEKKIYKEAIAWLRKSVSLAIELNSIKERERFKDSYHSIISGLMGVGEIKLAGVLAREQFLEECKNPKRANKLFSHGVLLSLGTGEFQNAIDIFQKASLCGVNKKTIRNISYSFNHYIHSSKVAFFILNKMPNSKDFILEHHLNNYFKTGVESSLVSLLSKYSAKFSPQLVKKITILLKIKNFKAISQEQFVYVNAGDTFDEVLFNQQLEVNVSKITALTNEYSKLIELGYGEVNIKLYSILSKTYKNFAESLTNIEILNKDDDFKKSFQMAMQGLSKQFNSKAKVFARSLVKTQSQLNGLIGHDMINSQTLALK